MEEKNRFSQLLDNLMEEAELKNYMLAQKLQYDVSYISKWVSGRMIPSEKTAEKVMKGICDCIVEDASDIGRENLLSIYKVRNSEELKLAIYDNLEAEYLYVKELQKSTGHEVAPKTQYFPEMNIRQYISKMHHPVLRRVNSLNVISLMDLMTMDYEDRIQFTTIDNEHMSVNTRYPDVHYSMVINIRPDKWRYVEDTFFLIHLISDNAMIDFQLYGDSQAMGKMIFAVKDDFVISGILINRNICMSVGVSEDSDTCNTIYKNIRMQCSRERLLFRTTNIREMISNFEYSLTLLSPNLRWEIGHLTEHFLPDDLFEEIIEKLCKEQKILDEDRVRMIHKLTQKVIQESNVKILISESAFSNMVIEHKIDFFNHPIYLNADQRMRCAKHILSLCENNHNLDIRLIYEKFGLDFDYSDHQSTFLADTITHLRLKYVGSPNNVIIINRMDMHKIFERTFEELWNYGDNVILKDRATVIGYIKHMMRSIELTANIEEENE